MGGAAASHWKTERGAHKRLDVWTALLHTSEATSATDRTPAKESAGIKIGMLKIRWYMNDVLIPQPAPRVSVRNSTVWLIIMDPTAEGVNDGEVKYLKTNSFMLISIIQQKRGTSLSLTST